MNLNLDISDLYLISGSTFDTRLQLRNLIFWMRSKLSSQFQNNLPDYNHGVSFQNSQFWLFSYFFLALVWLPNYFVLFLNLEELFLSWNLYSDWFVCLVFNPSVISIPSISFVHFSILCVTTAQGEPLENIYWKLAWKLEATNSQGRLKGVS